MSLFILKECKHMTVGSLLKEYCQLLFTFSFFVLSITFLVVVGYTISFLIVLKKTSERKCNF